jgi:hypothetical protein
VAVIGPAWQIQSVPPAEARHHGAPEGARALLTIVHEPGTPHLRIETSWHPTLQEARETRDAAMAFYAGRQA